METITEILKELEEDIKDCLNKDNLIEIEEALKTLKKIQSMAENDSLKLKINNTTGFTGVYRNKTNGKFKAQIRQYGKQCYLGTFESAEEASKIYLAERLKIRGN